VLYFYAWLPHITNHGESITVPNIEGLPIDKVKDFLADHDLRFEINDSAYSSQYPPLTVLKQYPSAGAKVKENRKVYVSINRINPPTVPMPDILNGSLINAEAVLKGSELKRGKIHLVRGPFLNLVQEIRVNGNKVVPNARVPKGTVVDLVVMDGGSMFLPTPNVLKFSYEDARFSLLGSNLNVGKVVLVGDTTGVNPVVIKQIPAPNENIKVGEVVDLWIGESNAEVPLDEQDQEQSDGN
jgi:beta-lactam-binding protein with PASTA domain